MVDAYTDTEFSEGKVGVLPADAVSDDEVHYDNICVTLDTTLSVATTKSGVSPTEDYGDPLEASEISPVRMDDEVQQDHVSPTRDIPLAAPATGW
ncbi:MAG: hypothetical protein KAY24_10880, partial [Candidatus Eisenbacteria sp.]|nr:hypothetical protein [Candidatus Eisenbacteria bacterium]